MKKKIIWMMGPTSYKETGIGRYSYLFIEELKKEFDIKITDIKATPKSFKRYLYQLIINPIKAIFIKADYVILYEEGFLHMIPLLIFSNKKILVIYHHVPNNKAIENKILKIKNFIIKYTTIIFLNKVYKIIVPSNETKKALNKVYKINDSLIKVIYNPFTIQEKNNITIDKKLFLKKYNIKYNNELILLNVGSEEDRKNFTLLLKAIVASKNYKNIIFIKIGKPFVYRNRLENIKIIEQYKLPVFLIDRVSEEELSTFYEISDIYISPSLHEGFGRTLIEAQLHKLFIVASNIPIYKEILGDKNALFINKPFDIKKWKEFFMFIDKLKINKNVLNNGFENAQKFLLPNLLKEWRFLND